MKVRQHGLDGFRPIADNDLEKARRLTKLVQEAADFELVANPMGTNVCFWYIPSYFQMHPEECIDQRKEMVHNTLFNRMKHHSRCLIQQQLLTEFGFSNFFRLSSGGFKTRLEDMDFLSNETRRLGYHITPAETDE
jgi:glutamate/tyrosine decarboxylase-like PLP-dependent enzyme